MPPDQLEKRRLKTTPADNLSSGWHHLEGMRTKTGKTLASSPAVLRNALDAAFAPNGELFTTDGDLEADEGLPLVSADAQSCICPPGARLCLGVTGLANTPDYYIDSLPPTMQRQGRGTAGRHGVLRPRRVSQGIPWRLFHGRLFRGRDLRGIHHAATLAAVTNPKVERCFAKGRSMPVTDLSRRP